VNKIQIKKYSNRKLYIPKKGYVTLEDVAEIIKDGNTVEVTTKDTGKDITNAVLKEVLTKVSMSTDKLQGLIRG
jgi:polyhydroxyalkanoate synthesis regulator protein